MSTANCVNFLKFNPATAHLKGWKRVGVKYTVDSTDRVLQSGSTFAMVREIGSNFFVIGVGPDRTKLETCGVPTPVPTAPASSSGATPYMELFASSFEERMWVSGMCQLKVAPGIEKKLKHALSQGLDPEYKYDGTPLLMCAVGSTPEHAQLIRVLVAAGAKINRRAESTTALIDAAASCSVACVKVLLELGAKPDIAAYRKRTALYLAAQRENQECVELLLAAGANPDQPSDDGSTPRSVGVRWQELFAEYDAKKIHKEIAKSDPRHALRSSVPSKM